MKIKLKAVIIGGYATGGGGDKSGLPPTEAFTLTAAEFKVEFPGQQPTEEFPGLMGRAPEPQVLRNRYSKPEPPSAPAPSLAGGNDLNPFHLLKKLLLHAPD